MKKKEIKEYIVKQYSTLVSGYVHDENKRSRGDTYAMILNYEEILKDCFNIIAKKDDPGFKLFENDKLIFSG